MLKKIAFLFSVVLAILCVSCDSQKCDDESNIREEMTVIETSGTELTYDGNIDYVFATFGLFGQLTDKDIEDLPVIEQQKRKAKDLFNYAVLVMFLSFAIQITFIITMIKEYYEETTQQNIQNQEGQKLNYPAGMQSEYHFLFFLQLNI